MSDIDPNQALIFELTPDIERLYNDHQAKARDWQPQELVPYDLGQNYQSGYEWCPEEYELSDGVRSALFINLLTEDNLPYYYETINRWSVGHDHPWSQWARSWTAEEDRHSTVIREWIHVTRAIDPAELERARMIQMKGGEVPVPGSIQDLLAYTSLQELATLVAHSGTAHNLDRERGGKEVMSKVARDEKLHHEFYRELAVAAFAIDPSGMTVSAYNQIKNFDMPGTGIPGFTEHARKIADIGIYDFTKFKEKVVDPVIAAWDIEHLEGLSPEAEEARTALYKRLAQLDKAVTREKRRRAALAEA